MRRLASSFTPRPPGTRLRERRLRRQQQAGDDAGLVRVVMSRSAIAVPGDRPVEAGHRQRRRGAGSSWSARPARAGSRPKPPRIAPRPAPPPQRSPPGRPRGRAGRRSASHRSGDPERSRRPPGGRWRPGGCFRAAPAPRRRLSAAVASRCGAEGRLVVPHRAEEVGRRRAAQAGGVGEVGGELAERVRGRRRRRRRPGGRVEGTPRAATRSRVGGWVSVGWACSASRCGAGSSRPRAMARSRHGRHEVGGRGAGRLGGGVQGLGDARLHGPGAQQRPRGGVGRGRAGAGRVGRELARPAPVAHGEVEALHHEDAEAQGRAEQAERALDGPPPPRRGSADAGVDRQEALAVGGVAAGVVGEFVADDRRHLVAPHEGEVGQRQVEDPAGQRARRRARPRRGRR